MASKSMVVEGMLVQTSSMNLGNANLVQMTDVTGGGVLDVFAMGAVRNPCSTSLPRKGNSVPS